VDSDSSQQHLRWHHLATEILISRRLQLHLNLTLQRESLKLQVKNFKVYFVSTLSLSQASSESSPSPSHVHVWISCGVLWAYLSAGAYYLESCNGFPT
jgi:hypothetical protein